MFLETLEILDGKAKDHRVPLVGTLNIGKNPASDLVLDDPGVSWNHARIIRRNRALWIADLASTNGTFLDGRRLDSSWKRFKVGAEITFGKIRGRVLPAAQSPTPRPPGKKRPPATPAPEPLAKIEKTSHDTEPCFRLLDQLVIEEEEVGQQVSRTRERVRKRSRKVEETKKGSDTGKYAPPSFVLDGKRLASVGVEKISDAIQRERGEDTPDKLGSVLVVDDDAFFSTWASTVLNLEGYEAVTAKDGVDGLVQLSERRFSVVLCDMCMPHLDGTSFLEISRKKKIAAPVIFTSAKNRADEALNGGMAFLRKPVSQVELLECVKKVLEDCAHQPTISAEMRAVSDLMPGETVGDFVVERCLGKSHRGRVYLARQSSLARKVALKVFDPTRFENRSHGAQLLREAQAAASLVHPNVVQVYTVGVHAPTSQPFIAMEYVAGKSLEERIGSGEPHSFGQILHILESVVGALDRAREKGIVHRDVRPGNIVVSENWEVKVLDFGLAKPVVEEGPDSRGVSLGASAYDSPEQALGKRLDWRSDLYGLGVIGYELLAGSVPFCFDSRADAAWLHAFAPARGICEVRPNVPASFECVLERMLAKDRRMRYAEPAELLADLEEIRAGLRREKRLDSVPEGPPLPPVTQAEAEAGDLGQRPLNLIRPRQSVGSAGSFRWLVWALAALGVVALGALLWWQLG